MAALQLRNIEKTYSNGAVRVINGISLDIEDGEFIVFVGPSGCGKSTTLRMIAGLEEITGGDLYIDSKRVNELPAAKRGVAMVFQSYALYPHMTVAENLGFALKLAGKSKAEIAAASEKAARILHLEPLLHRKPKELSGGQRQRVAIGRCIVRQPKVFLFDEPLSNLDAALRVQMRAELARLHQELGTTMVYVTHDQVEAMTLGDRIAVFNQGIIEQCGSPRDLYENPANLFVATFIGSPSMNLLAVESRKTDTGIQLTLPGGAPWNLPDGSHDFSKLGNKLTLGLRPENLALTTAQQGIPAIAGLVEYHGGEQIVYTTLAGSDSEVTVKLGADSAPIKTSETIGIQIDPSNFHLFDANGKSIRRQSVC